MDILKILGSEKRREIMKMLINRELHISAIARELNISNPVALKHVNLLEGANLVERTYVGNTVIIKIKEEGVDLLKRLEDLIEKPNIVSVSKGNTLYDALKKDKAFSIKKYPGTSNYFIDSIDGKKGYYIVEVDGKIINSGIDKCKIKDDVIVEFKKLIPVLGKRMQVNVE